MDRRRTLATVASLTIGAGAIVAAVGATTRVFDVAEASPGVGRVSPVSTPTLPPVIEHRVIEIEDPAPPPAALDPGSSTVAHSDRPPASPPTRAATPPLVVAEPASPTTPSTVPPAPREHEPLGEDD